MISTNSQDPGAESINNKIKEAVQQALQFYVVEEKYFEYQEELYCDQELHKNYQKQIIEKKLSDLTTKPIQFRIQVNENQSRLNEHYNG